MQSSVDGRFGSFGPWPVAAALRGAQDLSSQCFAFLCVNTRKGHCRVLGYLVAFLIFGGVSQPFFHSGCTNLQSLQQCPRDPSPSPPRQRSFLSFTEESHGDRCEVTARRGFSLRFSDDQRHRASFRTSAGHPHVPFGEMPIQVLCSVFNGPVCLFEMSLFQFITSSSCAVPWRLKPRAFLYGNGNKGRIGLA